MKQEMGHRDDGGDGEIKETAVHATASLMKAGQGELRVTATLVCMYRHF
jgi:hypothetical protein